MLRLRVLQNSWHGGLPLLPPQVSNRGLLGRFFEGESMNGTTLRVCAGWRLDLLLKGSDMEKLKAKQTVSNLTEAEAIEQAKEGDAAAFEFLYKAHCRRVDSLNLMRAIRKLPAGYKKLFLMHDVIGYEHSEIAGLLGCSIGCSKSQVHKARKKLRRLLQGEHRRGEAGVAPAWEEADAGSLLDLTKLPEGDGEQGLANVVVEGAPPPAAMPASAPLPALSRP